MDNEAERLMDELLQEVTPTSGLSAFDEAMKEELACMGCVDDLINAFVDKKSIQVSFQVQKTKFVSWTHNKGLELYKKRTKKLSCHLKNTDYNSF